MKSYLVHFAQFHPTFRLPELCSLAELNGINMIFKAEDYSDSCPFLVIQLESDLDAQKLIQRSILVKEIVELWGKSIALESLMEELKSVEYRHRPEYQHCSFKIELDAFGFSYTQAEKLDIIEKFSWLGFNGPIDLRTPDATFMYYEDYSNEKYAGKIRSVPPQMVYFGRLIATGNRTIVKQYDLKKRGYLGTTSMDAELSLIMANQALARPGTFILDPFVGTGSFLISCSHFGAYTIGADIDGRQIKGGKGEGGIESNLKQYNLGNHVLGTLVCDLAHHPWREGEWFDAIVADPPYGVRAGAKKIAPVNQSGNPSPFKKNGELRYPTMEIYEMSQVVNDLIAFAATYLNVSGRLVFWLPTLNDEYTPEDIPTHPQMRLISNSEQNFGKWSRKLITMEKIGSVDGISKDLLGISISKPGHSNFREKYFSSK